MESNRSRDGWYQNGNVTSSFVDLRRFPRVHVDGGCTIRFQAGNRRYFGLPVVSLGGGGCSFEVSRILASAFQRDMLLSRVCIEHPEVPPLFQRARIAWVIGNQIHQDVAKVQVGIEYLEPDLDFVQAIDRCVSALLRKEVS
jgi:hypothetical protein